MSRIIKLYSSDAYADPGPDWDTDDDGESDWYINEQLQRDLYGNPLRDPGDLIPTIIFKQVDP